MTTHAKGRVAARKKNDPTSPVTLDMTVLEKQLMRRWTKDVLNMALYDIPPFGFSKDGWKTILDVIVRLHKACEVKNGNT